MSAEPGELGLHPGSRPPQAPEEVERLLKAVPGVAFQEEFAGCLIAADQLGDTPSPEEMDRVCDDAWKQKLLASIDALDARAEGQSNGGLKFLAHTLKHFLTVQKIALPEHPLAVGLYLRSHIRKAGGQDDFKIVLRKMDEWGGSAGED